MPMPPPSINSQFINGPDRTVYANELAEFSDKSDTELSDLENDFKLQPHAVSTVHLMASHHAVSEHGTGPVAPSSLRNAGTSIANNRISMTAALQVNFQILIHCLALTLTC
jgi:hypothetical protein